MLADVNDDLSQRRIVAEKRTVAAQAQVAAFRRAERYRLQQPLVQRGGTVQRITEGKPATAARAGGGGLLRQPAAEGISIGENAVVAGQVVHGKNLKLLSRMARHCT